MKSLAQGYYCLELAVGTPNTTISVLVDTESSDLVLDYSVYDPSKSTTAKNQGFQFEDWHIEYDMYTDTVTLDVLILENFNLGVGHNTDNNLGVGAQGLEMVSEKSQMYPNFPLALKNSDYIKSAEFSIYLESFDPSIQYGSILFGGIDHAKYTGELVSFPYGVGGPRILTAIEMSGLRFANSTYIPINAQVAVDTGTTTLAFPPAMAASISAVFGPLYPNGTIIDYQESWKTTFFSFEFAGLNVTVPYYDLLVSDNAGGYALQYIWTNEPIIILGDIFIRNAYTVYNYDLQVIQPAQINYEANGATNITVI